MSCLLAPPCVFLMHQVILLIAVLNGVTRMTGTGVLPENAVLEGMAEIAFKQVSCSPVVNLDFAPSVLNCVHCTAP